MTPGRIETGTEGAQAPPRPNSEAVADRADERDLLARTANGDAAAFRLLVERHLGVLIAVARRVLSDEAEAEDIAQEGLLRLWRLAGEIEIAGAGVRPWLRRVVSNLAIDRVRARRRVDVTDDVPEVAEAADQDTALEAQDLAGRVEAALQALPERQRLALVMFHFEDMSQRDVAERLAISEDALESLLARGRRALKSALADDWRELLGSRA